MKEFLAPFEGLPRRVQAAAFGDFGDDTHTDYIWVDTGRMVATVCGHESSFMNRESAEYAITSAEAMRLRQKKIMVHDMVRQKRTGRA